MYTGMVSKTLDKSLDLDAREHEKVPLARRHEALLRAVAEHRNKESFVQLFEHYAPRVKSYLMKGGTSEDVADELAQETMLTVWNRAPSYDPAQASVSTWIFTIARNKKIDSLRKTGRFEVAPADPEAMESPSSPHAETQALQETEALAAALKELPEEQAMLLHKSFFEDKSHADIAKETGLALGTVKSRIRLALERLRKNQAVRGLR